MIFTHMIFSPDYAGSDKQIYHFTYNINEDTLTTAQNISAKKYQILDYVFQNDLYKMVKKNKKKLQEKVKNARPNSILSNCKSG